MALKYKHRLLFVDDEESITKSLQRLFRKERYEIHTAPSGAEGLKLLQETGKSFSLIISDQRMPEMTGSEFLEKAKEVFPNAIRILLTGHADMNAIIDAVNKGEIHRYLTKPWDDGELLRLVREELERYELLVENQRLLALTKKQNKELAELNRNLEEKVKERSREIVLKNKELAGLNRELETGLYNTVRAFGSLVEMHNPDLAGHGRRVSIFSREIAQSLELPEEEIVDIEIAGLLHDIGKLGFSPRLLKQEEDRLSPEEKDLFRTHPEQGQSTVRFINKLDNVGILIRAHHERNDGQGYPDHLPEEAIPTGAKIIAVADAYDRMVNLKPDLDKAIGAISKATGMTQKSLTEEEALNEAAILHLKKESFTRYDPDVVKVFLNLLKTKGLAPPGEKEISFDGLKEGMVLTRPLYASSGRFLLPHNTTLTENYIRKLREFDKTDPVLDRIYVYQK